ncbi:MAG: tRNA (N6-isopentenyl adenosine(37)-C2)-methylthiotransferase MiaB [Spirochaetes bacterium]|nr:tRNA (N6-isopentenyl adenosine(37)-C2)-methylthiotransferase MiaB [Spirochaetota bacterium]
MERYYWIETYGCQMNKAESNALVQEMTELGWRQASSPKEAEIIILNTCSVRGTAEMRIRGRIGYYKSLKRTHPHTLVLMGCMAERLKERLKEEEPAVDLVVGTFQKGAFLSFLRNPCRDRIPHIPLQENAAYQFAEGHYLDGEFKAFIPIMHGCNNFCSYCIVPYVRGREVSRSPEEIFRELNKLQDRGVQEITLIGQNVNSYLYEGPDGRMDFPSLLREIIHRYPDIPWIRFLTSHPKDLSDEVIDCLATYSQLCKSLHLPVQHGSNRILRLMNRKYDRDFYLRLVERLRNRVPSIALTTDILIGFPTETEEDFQATLELMKAVRFDDAFTYYYNPREGTEAYKYPDDVPLEVKLERLKVVIDLQRRIGREKKTQRIGSRIKVLVEEMSKMKSTELLCRTERDEMVIVPGPSEWIGTFREVELLSLKGNTFWGKDTGWEHS